MDRESHGPRFPQYEKRLYRSIFQVPDQNWKVEADWEDAYYQSARHLLEGVERGDYLPGYEGVVGLYLFRHYIELALKFVIFHSRWLKDAQTNARFDEIEDIKKRHALKPQWDRAKTECQRIVPPEEWSALDLDFVERCVVEFDAVDRNGERFRYHGPRFGVEKSLAKRAEMARSIRPDLYVEFDGLPAVLEHVHDVLSYLMCTWLRVMAKTGNGSNTWTRSDLVGMAGEGRHSTEWVVHIVGFQLCRVTEGRDGA